MECSIGQADRPTSALLMTLSGLPLSLSLAQQPTPVALTEISQDKKREGVEILGLTTAVSHR